MKRIFYFTAIFMLILSLCSCGKYAKSNTYTEGNYKITVKQGITFSFGASKVKIIAENTQTNQKEEFETEIKDDGGLGNIEFYWTSDYSKVDYDAYFCLTGSEMTPTILKVYYSDTITISPTYFKTEGYKPKKTEGYIKYEYPDKWNVEFSEEYGYVVGLFYEGEKLLNNEKIILSIYDFKEDIGTLNDAEKLIFPQYSDALNCTYDDYDEKIRVYRQVTPYGGEQVFAITYQQKSAVKFVVLDSKLTELDILPILKNIDIHTDLD